MHTLFDLAPKKKIRNSKENREMLAIVGDAIVIEKYKTNNRSDWLIFQYENMWRLKASEQTFWLIWIYKELIGELASCCTYLGVFLSNK